MRWWSIASGLAGVVVGVVLAWFFWPKVPPRMAVQVVAASGAHDGTAQAAVAAALAEDEVFAAANGRGLELLGTLHTTADGPVLALALEVPASVRDAFEVSTLRIEVPVDRAGDPQALHAAAKHGLSVLGWRLALARGEASAAVALLRTHEPAFVLVALDWLHDFPHPELADEVAAQLSHPDIEVVRTALEVLAVLGGPAQAAAVVRRVEIFDDVVREGYETLAVLGGPDALGFLRFAAANEDDPELQQAAARALEAALLPAQEGNAGRRSGVDLPKLARGHRR